MIRIMTKQIGAGLSAMGLAVVMICGMTGCAGTSENAGNDSADITIEAIVQANSRDSILSRHDNVMNTIEGDYIYTTQMYVSSDYGYDLSSEGVQRLVDADGHNWQYADVDGTKYLAYMWFVMDDEELSEQTGHFTMDNYSAPVINENTTSKETIEDVKDNGDGTLTVTTLVKAEDSAEFYKSESEDLDVEYPEEYYTNDKQCVYIINSDSLEIVSCEESLLTEDGEEFVDRYTVVYDTEPTGDLADMIALAEEFNSEKPEDPKNLTIIYDYGTDSEQTYKLTTDQKFKVMIYLKDGYKQLYDDPEGQIIHESGSAKSDITMYTFKAE